MLNIFLNVNGEIRRQSEIINESLSQSPSFMPLGQDEDPTKVLQYSPNSVEKFTPKHGAHNHNMTSDKTLH